MKKLLLLVATTLLVAACVTDDSQEDVQAAEDQTQQSDGTALDVTDPTDSVTDITANLDAAIYDTRPDLSQIDVVSTDQLEMMEEDEIAPDICAPRCVGKECGDDKCGGLCGTCPAAAPFCVAGLCELACTPSCDGASCGDDGCGGSCGTCPEGETCVDGLCDLPCPVAVIHCEEGDEAVVQATLHLSGFSSYAGSGKTISKVLWSVVQPDMSQSLFDPSDSSASPTFQPNVVGTYEFGLRVWDSDGVPSCATTKHTVAVVADEAIHIELLWHTPGDANETDEGPEAGADLDLHLAHPLATGPDVDLDGLPDPWFDNMYDCFWFNSHPNWGSLDPDADDDPSLDRDDTDGAGPENINFNNPAAETTYRVGIHYWSDHDFGPSTAVLRVYVLGSLSYEVSQEIESLDMWDACTISWPSGTITPVTAEGGGAKISPEYQNPMFAN